MTTDSSSPKLDEPTDMHDLGVLFVHGIGEQQQGSTLVASGEPLYRWLDRWSDGIVASWTHVGLQQKQELEWYARHSASWPREGDPQALADALDTRRAWPDTCTPTSSPLQQAAIVAQVQRDVAWLSSRCRTVAVIAHSQGGAVAHRALRRHRPSNVQVLLTFGSGLRKLEEMEDIARIDDGLYGRVYLTVAAVVLLGYSGWAMAASAPGVAWTAGTGVGLFVFLVLSYLSRAHALDGAWFMTLLREPGLWWADYHATADPVSNGPLEDHDFRTGGAGEEASAAPRSDGPVSVSVCNERSFRRDHTTYWQNTEEFVGPVVMWLTWLTPGPWHRAVTRSPAQRATDLVRRRWRVGALVVGRWVAALAVVAVVAARFAAWLEVGRWASAGATSTLSDLLQGELAGLLPARYLGALDGA